MSRLFVHIGLPKAASSTLQRSLFARHPGLMFLGPRADRPEIDRAFRSLKLDRDFDPAPLRDAVPQDARLPLVLSDEALTAYGADIGERARRLRSAIEPAGVIVCLRRPEDFVISSYLQYARGAGKKFDRLPSLEDWLEEGRIFRGLRYADILSAYAGQQMLVLLFEDLVAQPARFAAEVSDFLGVCPETTRELLARPPENQRISRHSYWRARLAHYPMVSKGLLALRHVVPSRLRQKARAPAKLKLPTRWQRRVKEFAFDQAASLDTSLRQRLDAYGYF